VLPQRSPSQVWPVLVADLADDAARDYLVGLALAGGRACLPLIAAPANASTHILEIYTPGSPEPLLLFAEPLGPPSRAGFPLHLRIYDGAGAAAGKPIWAPEQRSERRPVLAAHVPVAPVSELRPRQPTQHTLTERHTRDLGGDAAPATPRDLLGRALAGGKLRIESVIGSGGVGSVFRASHRDLRIPVAVKVLHERFQRDIEFCKRFHAEALAASRLDHPNLMRVLDFGQEPDGLLYLAMEFLDGRCLADILEPGTALPLPRIVDLGLQVCAGIAHAHARGIVHRDIKPDNVVLVASVDDDERPCELAKVCDFGIAVADSEATDGVVGTPDYMSPEQCRGEPLDGRSDIYSVGVMLYELATGQMPFYGEDVNEIIERHIHAPPPPPTVVNPSVHPSLEAVILRAMDKDPSRRHQTMRELRSELRALVAPLPARPAPPAKPPSLPPIARTTPLSTPPPPPPMSAVATRSASAPEWLERGNAYDEVMRRDSLGEVPTHDVHARLLAGELATKPAPWLAAFASSATYDQFDVLARRLGAAVPLLVAERNVRALFAIRCTLDVLAADDPNQPSWRAAGARTLQHAFQEVPLLGFLAEAALSDDRPPREITELLLRAGTPATYALYSARLRLTACQGVRSRFADLLRAFGNEALPMIRAGLAKLEARRELAVAASLAMDLLEAAPRVRDDEAGAITARYLVGSTTELTCAAAAAIVAFWGTRATPLLVGLLAADDDRARIAAIQGLRELRAVDAHVARSIVRAATSSTSAELQSAARAALDEAGPAARRPSRDDVAAGVRR